MNHKKAVILCNREETFRNVFGQGRLERLAAVASLYPEVVGGGAFEAHAGQLADVEVAFSTWGMPSLTESQVARMPSLKAVFYAAGTVKAFAPPFLSRGIIVCSAWGANAVSVAEFCLGQVLLACKGYFRNTRECRDPEAVYAKTPFRGKGAYGETIALIGAGQIGRKLIELLRPFRLRILVVDPYLADADAATLGVERVSLETAFREACVVSNHLPNLPSLQKVLDRTLFASMRQGATFINTGRGAQVNEEDLLAVWRERPDLMALLDVTYPEPPARGSGLFALPNIQLSNHMAGAHDDEVVRMADYMLDEFARYRAGEPLRYSVSLDMLDRMA